MRWNLHGLTIEGEVESKALRDQWQVAFRSLPASVQPPDIHMAWRSAERLPPMPRRTPDFRDGEHVMYWVAPGGKRACARFPKYAQLNLDLEHGRTDVVIQPAAMEQAGVFEDLVAVGLSPHCRRRNLFLIHAFAASREGRAALLVGPRKSGKTTTGLALLRAGWSLLSNDSPLLRAGGKALQYPGLLSAFEDSLALLGLDGICPGGLSTGGKRQVAAEELRTDIWCDRADVGAVFLMRPPDGAPARLEPRAAPQALVELLPHAIEQWDQDMIPAHLSILRELVESAPAFALKPGPDIGTMTERITAAVFNGQP